MICIGTGISNSNQIYPTETTLFQSVWDKEHNTIYVDGQQQDILGFHQQLKATEDKPVCVRDGYDNYYYIKQGNVNIQIAEQESCHEKDCSVTKGTFASAWLHHGCAPQNETYEYAVWIQPTPQELATIRPMETYHVLQKDNNAHILYDIPTNTTAYSIFESITLEQDSIFQKLPAETMVMSKTTDNSLLMSVCDPNLNIREKAFTTKEPSRPINKAITLRKEWELTSENKHVTLEYKDHQTLLHVRCQHGIPVEFTLRLIKSRTSSLMEE